APGLDGLADGDQGLAHDAFLIHDRGEVRRQEALQLAEDRWRRVHELDELADEHRDDQKRQKHEDKKRERRDRGGGGRARQAHAFQPVGDGIEEIGQGAAHEEGQDHVAEPPEQGQEDRRGDPLVSGLLPDRARHGALLSLPPVMAQPRRPRKRSPGALSFGAFPCEVPRGAYSAAREAGAAVQKQSIFAEFTEITPSAPIDAERHGWRAKCLQRLIRLDLPVPRTVALSADTVRAIAAGVTPDTARLAAAFGGALVTIRPSPATPHWGGPTTVLNVGMTGAKHAEIAEVHGRAYADALYLGFVQSYAIHVARLDPDMFTAEPSPEALAAALAAYEAEMDEEFPQSPARQMGEVLRSMARAWEGTTARLLREAKGAPSDAALGLVMQEMAQAVGPGLSGTGTIQLIEPVTGAPQVTGRFRGLNPANRKAEETLYLVRDRRGHSLE